MPTLTDTNVHVPRAELERFVGGYAFTPDRTLLREARFLLDAWFGDTIVLEKGTRLAEALVVAGARS